MSRPISVAALTLLVGCFAAHDRVVDTGPLDTGPPDVADTTPPPPPPPRDTGPDTVIEDAMPPPPDATTRPARAVSFALSVSGMFLWMDDGRFYSLGDTRDGPDGRFGQLGSPRAPAPDYFFARYEGAFRFEGIAAARITTCGTTGDADRSVYCWGANSRGALGIGSSDSGRVELEPVRASISRVSEVTAGSDHMCVLDREGLVACWGSNTRGQLGSGFSIIVSRPSPEYVMPDVRWRMVATSYEHTCAVRDIGTLFCWGAGTAGQLGNGMTVDQPGPVQVGTDDDWTYVSAGAAHTCGLRGADGRLFCWGQNAAGELGEPAPSMRASPIALPEAGWVSVSAGHRHTCGLRDEDGVRRAHCWGSGALGVSGVSSSDTPVAIVSPESWSSITAGRSITCGVSDGRGYCWGNPSELPFASRRVSEPEEVRLEPAP